MGEWSGGDEMEVVEGVRGVRCSGDGVGVGKEVGWGSRGG